MAAGDRPRSSGVLSALAATTRAAQGTTGLGFAAVGPSHRSGTVIVRADRPGVDRPGVDRDSVPVAASPARNPGRADTARGSVEVQTGDMAASTGAGRAPVTPNGLPPVVAAHTR